jgi:hypothetical protein
VQAAHVRDSRLCAAPIGRGTAREVDEYNGWYGAPSMGARPARCANSMRQQGNPEEAVHRYRRVAQSGMAGRMFELTLTLDDHCDIREPVQCSQRRRSQLSGLPTSDNALVLVKTAGPSLRASPPSPPDQGQRRVSPGGSSSGT